MRSRRRFLGLLAAGSVAALAGSGTAAPLAEPTNAAAPSGSKRPRTAAARAEIESQKRSLDKALATIRKFELPPGSDMAFGFRPLKAARGGSRKRSGSEGRGSR